MSGTKEHVPLAQVADKEFHIASFLDAYEHSLSCDLSSSQFLVILNECVSNNVTLRRTMEQSYPRILKSALLVLDLRKRW